VAGAFVVALKRVGHCPGVRYKNVILLYETFGRRRGYIQVDKMKSVALRSIAFNYPGFQSLPRSIKQMLVLTESFFFGEDRARNGASLGHPSAPPLTIAPMALVPVSFSAVRRH
jgi:hypothetical protein